MSNKQIVKTAADKIWEEIKDLKIDMFALADQRVHMYCKPVPIDPSKLFLVYTAGSVLPALEAAVYPKYVVERADKFIIVSAAESPFTKR
jgi:hypothetical protein